MESWVNIKKGNQISRVPYQAFKDVFEQDGFALLVDETLNADPTFSNSPTNAESEKAKVKETNKEEQSESTRTKKHDNQRLRK